MRSRHPASRKWIGEATEHSRPGALHRQLGIDPSERIPSTLLAAIHRAPVGTTIRNPTETGKTRIGVTRKLKARAVFAENVR